MQPQRNVELKARLLDLEAARTIAQRLATARLGSFRQVDTYFHCKCGRMKLREFDDGAAELIAYDRADAPAARTSRYLRVPISDAGPVKQALTAALGVRSIVDKRREVFLYHNVRIHLDQVAGLGDFLEFEAVLDPAADEATGHAQIAMLREAFRETLADLVPVSYCDLLGADSTLCG